jgi:hypothetical protein
MVATPSSHPFITSSEIQILQNHPKRKKKKKKKKKKKREEKKQEIR